MFGKNYPCLDFKLQIHKKIGKKRGVVLTYRWWLKSNLGFAHKAPYVGEGTVTKCWNKIIVTKLDFMTAQKSDPFPPVHVSMSPNLYFHKCFPGVASRQRLSSDWNGCLAWLSLTMIYEFGNHNTSIFWARHSNLDNYRLFIDSVHRRTLRYNVPRWY